MSNTTAAPRTNFSHKACDHDSTPAARKACRKARKGDNVPTEIEVLTAALPANLLEGFSAKMIDAARTALDATGHEATDSNIAALIQASRVGKMSISKMTSKAIARHLVTFAA